MTSFSGPQIHQIGQRINVAGVRSDIGPMYFHSKMEANYARYLNLLQHMGVVESWRYEPETFWFLAIKRGTRSYKPDFRVLYANERAPVYVEVKGYMDKKSKTKIGRFRKYYPQYRLEIVGQTEFAAIKRKWASAIPTWE
jgi:hypothetical protein